MKARLISLALATVCFVSVAVCSASDVFLGTWRLNVAKSIFAPGAPKNTTVVYEAVGDGVKVTTDGIDSEGKPTHTEWTGKFDGKDYPVTGDPSADERSYTRVDEDTLAFTDRKAGNIMFSGRIDISADGKTRLVHTTGTDSLGKRVTSKAVYDRQ